MSPLVTGINKFWQRTYVNSYENILILKTDLWVPPYHVGKPYCCVFYKPKIWKRCIFIKKKDFLYSFVQLTTVQNISASYKKTNYEKLNSHFLHFSRTGTEQLSIKRKKFLHLKDLYELFYPIFSPLGEIFATQPPRPLMFSLVKDDWWITLKRWLMDYPERSQDFVAKTVDRVLASDWFAQIITTKMTCSHAEPFFS